MPVNALRRAIVKHPQTRQLTLFLLQSYAGAQVWRRGPRVFVNSFPKAGTHLMTAELAKIDGVADAYLHLQPRDFNKLAPDKKRRLDVDLDLTRLEQRLRRVRGGQFVTAHFAFHADFHALLQRLDYKTIFVIRDPRDVLISDLNYIKTLPRHFLHRTLMERFADDEARLEAMISGIDGPPQVRCLRDRWQQYLDWMDAPGVLTVRFEELVGSRGGGDDALKRRTMRRVTDHLGLAVRELSDEALSQTTWTPTLRTGRTNRWREVMSEAQRRLFDAEMGAIMARLGYGEMGVEQSLVS